MGAETEEVELAIAALGAGGDGIARHEGETVYVPLAAPGDVLRARLGAAGKAGRRAEIVALIEPGPTRADAPCPHFGLCGGCRVQHLEARTYEAWKRGILETALRRQGFPEVRLAPTFTAPLGSRRRTRLAAERRDGALALGFREQASRRVAEIASCLVLRSEIVTLLPALRAMLAETLRPGEAVELPLALLDDGLDLVIEAKREPSLAEREALAAFAECADLARLSWRTRDAPPEPVVERRPAVLRFGKALLRLPPGAFLQPTREGEAMLLDLVLDALGADAKRIADLYCGAGAFALPLAERASVLAVDGDTQSVAALEAAARGADLHPRLRSEVRDLERAPLRTEELTAFDAVLFDPPRGGAPRQAKELATSQVPLVLAVSCNPVSFARDARILAEGGYAIGTVHPVDQFLFTPHLEVFAAFRLSPHKRSLRQSRLPKRR